MKENYTREEYLQDEHDEKCEEIRKNNVPDFCNRCEYSSYRMDGKEVYPICYLTGHDAPEKDSKVCPVAERILYLYYGRYCMGECNDYEGIDFDNGIDCNGCEGWMIKKIEDYLKKDCQHKHVVYYQEELLKFNYQNVSICLDCGHFQLSSAVNHKEI